LQSTETDSNGEFALSGIYTGVYNLVVTGPDGTIMTVFIEVTDSSNHDLVYAVVLPAGGHDSNFMLDLSMYKDVYSDINSYGSHNPDVEYRLVTL